MIQSQVYWQCWYCWYQTDPPAKYSDNTVRFTDNVGIADIKQTHQSGIVMIQSGLPTMLVLLISNRPTSQVYWWYKVRFTDIVGIADIKQTYQPDIVLIQSQVYRQCWYCWYQTDPPARYSDDTVRFTDNVGIADIKQTHQSGIVMIQSGLLTMLVLLISNKPTSQV